MAQFGRRMFVIGLLCLSASRKARRKAPRIGPWKSPWKASRKLGRKVSEKMSRMHSQTQNMHQGSESTDVTENPSSGTAASPCISVWTGYPATLQMLSDEMSRGRAACPRRVVLCSALDTANPRHTWFFRAIHRHSVAVSTAISIQHDFQRTSMAPSSLDANPRLEARG